jgi:hypothetical protein
MGKKRKAYMVLVRTREREGERERERPLVKLAHRLYNNIKMDLTEM